MKLVKHSLLPAHSSKLQAIKLQKVYPSARWIDLFSCLWSTRQSVTALLLSRQTTAGSQHPWAENTRNHRACSPVFTENGWNHRVFSPVFDKNMRNHRVFSLVFMKNDWEAGASRLFLKKMDEKRPYLAHFWEKRWGNGCISLALVHKGMGRLSEKACRLLGKSMQIVSQKHCFYVLR